MDFKNTLLIMTSNVGSSVIEKGGGQLGFQLDIDQVPVSFLCFASFCFSCLRSGCIQSMLTPATSPWPSDMGCNTLPCDALHCILPARDGELILSLPSSFVPAQ